MANKLNDEELSNVEGGTGNNDIRRGQVRCCECSKKVEYYYLLDGKKYCKDCYEKKTFNLKSPKGFM